MLLVFILIFFIVIIVLIASLKVKFIIKVNHNKHSIYLNLYMFGKVKIYSVSLEKLNWLFNKNNPNNKVQKPKGKSQRHSNKNVNSKEKLLNEEKKMNINKRKNSKVRNNNNERKEDNKRKNNKVRKNNNVKKENNKRKNNKVKKDNNEKRDYNAKRKNILVNIIKSKKCVLEELYLKTDICTTDAICTSYLVALLSSIIAVGIELSQLKINPKKFYFKINPIYTDKKVLNIKLKCIISTNLVHIILIFFRSKKRLEK